MVQGEGSGAQPPGTRAGPPGSGERPRGEGSGTKPSGARARPPGAGTPADATDTIDAGSTSTIQCPGCQSWHDRRPTPYDESGYLCLDCQFTLASDDRDAEPVVEPASYEPDTQLQ